MSFMYISTQSQFARPTPLHYRWELNITTKILFTLFPLSSGQNDSEALCAEWTLLFYERRWVLRYVYKANSMHLLKNRQVQLPSYNFTKHQLVKHNILPADSTWTFLASSSVSGLCVVCDILWSFARYAKIDLKCLVMQPADTVSLLFYLVLLLMSCFPGFNTHVQPAHVPWSRRQAERKAL